MPTSNLAVWPWIIQYVHEVPHERILDVGPGWGKAATLLREYLNTKPEQIDAIELHDPYVEAHRLHALYDEVLVGDVCDLDDDELARYDLVLMVDVIEHIEKERAVELLQRIPGRVVICTPVEFFSNGPGLPESETHRSHWTADDWAATKRVEVSGQQLGGWVVRLRPRRRR